MNDAERLHHLADQARAEIQTAAANLQPITGTTSAAVLAIAAEAIVTLSALHGRAYVIQWLKRITEQIEALPPRSPH